MNEILKPVVSELISTPNGQIRMVGGILCIGAAFGGGFGLVVYETLAAGSFVAGVVLILISAYMADRKTKFESGDRRLDARPELPVSDRTLEFVRQFTGAMEQHEIASMPFVDDDDLTLPDAIKKLKVMRAKEAAWQGDLIYWTNGLYVPRHTTSETIIQAPNEGV